MVAIGQITPASLAPLLRRQINGDTIDVLEELSVHTMIEYIPWPCKLIALSHAHDDEGDIELDVAINGVPIAHAGGAGVYSRNTRRFLNLNRVACDAGERVTLIAKEYSEIERAPGDTASTPIGGGTIIDQPSIGATTPNPPTLTVTVPPPTEPPLTEPPPTEPPTVPPTDPPTDPPTGPPPTDVPTLAVNRFAWTLVIERT